MNVSHPVPARRMERALVEDSAVRSWVEEGQASDSALQSYLLIAFRRKWLILACIVAGLIGGMLLTFSTVRLYRAATTLEIAREASRVVTEQKGVELPSTIGNVEFYQTQYGLLRSRMLAEAVVRELRLADNPTLLYGYSGRKADRPATPTAGQRKNMENRAVALVQGNMVVTPIRGSGLVEVSFASPSPDLSAAIANATAENFIESNLARRFNATAYARRFLERQLADTRAKLEVSERKLVDYANSQGLINIDRTGADGQSTGGQSLPSIDLEALNSALAQAKADRIAEEAKARGAGGSSAALTRTLSDPAITSMRQARADLSGQRAKLLAQFKPDYPPVKALDDQIAEIDRQLSRQTSVVGSSVNADYRAAVTREAQLQAQVNRLKSEVLSFRSRSIQYTILQRETDTNRGQYQALLQRYKEIGVAGGVGVNNASVVDPAVAPSSPFTPRPVMNLLVGALLGAVLGFAAAYVLAHLDATIGTPHELESKIGVPLLGSIPRMGGDVNVVESLNDRRSTLVEAYNSVQTSLRFSTSHGAPRGLLVTSARAAEGKSTTSVAIAQNFARQGQSVVLVDGDMRNPSLHRLLGLPNAGGLSNALAGADDLEPLLNRLPDTTMAVMSAGPLPPNPAELLAGPRFSEVLAQLGQKFDHVVVDGPPVLGLADAPLLASYVEATVFVVAANETHSKAARIALARLADARAHIVGAVFTKFDAQQIGYDYGYNYDYGRRRITGASA